ncbi:MAG: hypothetical protein U5L45_20905 [Saprospiraceae bacterium]|nr:hypothetical protein [Saprospiraceae bacterium]MDZ7880150.1 hypothetical protein [Saprospiraceae bacterium]
MDSLKVFKRRSDLTPQRRMLLAYVVSYQKRSGQVSQLSRKHHVSRTFLYENTKKHASIYQTAPSCNVSKEAQIESCQKSILSYRLFGNCSLNAIQTLLERDEAINKSLGYVSEFLRDAGQAVGQDLNLSSGAHQTYQLVFASDEIFFGDCAILITVEPLSLAILRIELVAHRTSENWQEHWQSIAPLVQVSRSS